MPIILTEEKEKEKGKGGDRRRRREGWKTCACVHKNTPNTHIHADGGNE